MFINEVSEITYHQYSLLNNICHNCHSIIASVFMGQCVDSMLWSTRATAIFVVFYCVTLILVEPCKSVR